MMIAIGGRQYEAQRGMVLVVVLWIISLLAVMAGSFAYSMRIETRIATGAVERAQARALAEAGVAYAFVWQLDPDSQEWPPDGNPRDWRFGSGRLQIRVEDAAGRVSLNSNNARLIQHMLVAVGMPEDEAESVAAAIQDWRDQDDEARPGGAERMAYQAAGRPGPKNGRFESVEELQQVLGVSLQVAQHIADLVTVYSRASGINPEVAPARVLRAISDLDEQELARYVSDRTRAAREGEPLPPFPAGEQASFFSRSRSSAYHILTMVETPSGATIKTESVVSRIRVPSGQAMRLLSWRFGY